jgi:hypothetical protein
MKKTDMVGFLQSVVQPIEEKEQTDTITIRVPSSTKTYFKSSFKSYTTVIAKILTKIKEETEGKNIHEDSLRNFKTDYKL